MSIEEAVSLTEIVFWVGLIFTAGYILGLVVGIHKLRAALRRLLPDRRQDEIRRNPDGH